MSDKAFKKAFKEYRFSGTIIEADAEHFWQAASAEKDAEIERLKALRITAEAVAEFEEVKKLRAEVARLQRVVNLYEKALEKAVHDYPRADISYLEYRVEICRTAKAALAAEKEPK